MLKYILLAALVSIVFYRINKHVRLMGYYKTNVEDEFDSGTCEMKHHSVKQQSRVYFLNNTVDVDMLVGNGMALLINANFYPVLDAFKPIVKHPYSANMFMLDMNQLEYAEPLPLNIIGKAGGSTEFNLFALSLYTDGKGTLKIIAANYKPQTFYKDEKNDEIIASDERYSIEEFVYDGVAHQLLHVDTFTQGFAIDEVCDIVAVDDYIFYFTRCYSNKYLKRIKFLAKYADGEVWVFNKRSNLVYPVIRNILMPKSIAYIKSRSVVVVTNFDASGVSLYRREYDNSLTWIQDVHLNGLVFNIFIDFTNSIWTVTHPIPHRTFGLHNSNRTQTPATLNRVKLESRATDFRISIKTYCQTTGSKVNALNTIVYHKNNLVLFSLLNEPRVCFQIENE